MMFHVVLHRSGPAWDGTRALEEQSGWAEHASFMDGLSTRASSCSAARSPTSIGRCTLSKLSRRTPYATRSRATRGARRISASTRSTRGRSGSTHDVPERAHTGA
jgi:hypothetical protein